MELGSGSFSSSSAGGGGDDSASADSSLNIGLKIGQETYFKEVGSGAGTGGRVKSGNGSSSAAGGSLPPSSSPAKKGRSGAAQGGQPARCQVEGCNVDLSDVKAYYSRHKVCAMHSKSPTVVVAGIEQRFCQQCSRFHQLPEFDQGKRSCRRRLAGHNERRRKPPPGTLFSPRFGSLSPPLFDNNSKASGGFLMDFSSYQNPSGRESWPDPRAFGQAWDGRSTPPGRFHQQGWQHSNSEEAQPELLLQGSAYHGSNNVVPSEECFDGGIPPNNCALSLLSNQPWGSRNQPLGLEVNSSSGFVGAPDGTPAVHPSSDFSNPPWGFKVSQGSSSSSEMLPDLGLGKISHPNADGHYSGEIGMAQENENAREYLGLEHSRGYDSSLHNMHWSL
ncbi:unnamed protein product [Cuscuta epithymum]|uniref:SBP-type domain-containing protein n=1 Tax=Cuscuta epithymum TaxID=186058 RepID=A0AAV0C869_9ASTE|nr:unnamed protein product [Cuscuta epithymum]CAH9134999.1 unnamed protein product [Cuscuta epithymum]